MGTTAVVGTRWDAAGVPLPAQLLPEDRAAVGFELGVEGLFVRDEERDPLAVDVADRAGEARWLAAQQSRHDRRLAATYLRGAAELAFRSSATTEAERRGWGARAMLAELACALRLPDTTLARRLTRITTLAAFPRLREAAEAGRISSWHVDVVLDVFAGVTDPAVLGRADEALVDRALTATAPELRASARRWRARHVPRTPEQRQANLAARRVELSPADEDMMWLSALVPAAAGVAIDRRLETLADVVLNGAGEQRTRDQARADELVGLLLDPDASGRGYDEGTPSDGDGRPSDAAVPADDARPTDATGSPAGARPAGARVCTGAGSVPEWVRGVKADLMLTVPVLSLLGRSDELAELEGFGPIDLDTARLLAGTATSFVRVLTHPETGAVLSVGRDRYRLPADLRRAVQVRDQRCRFPGCRRRARGCDVDHSTDWQYRGGTDIGNLACLCRKHHRLKHEMGWKVEHEPGGVLRWTSPLGRLYRTEPATLWPPPPTPSPRRADGDEADSMPSGYPDEPPF